MSSIFKMMVVGGALWALAQSACEASLVWTYDFPGTPGSGIANNQTNPQTGNVTFGDWSRVNLSAVGTTGVYDTNFWNTTSVFDSTQYETFTITANATYHLDLQQISFDQMRTSGGPTKGLIQIFINGSASVYDLFSYNPSASFQNKIFNFTPITDADNATSIEFRFYGWNGGTPDQSLILDNVMITGVGVVPETRTLGPLALLLGGIVIECVKRRRSRTS